MQTRTVQNARLRQAPIDARASGMMETYLSLHCIPNAEEKHAGAHFVIHEMPG